MTVTGIVDFGINRAGLTDLVGKAYTNSGLGTQVGSNFTMSSFTDVGGGEYSFSATVGDSARWFTVNSPSIGVTVAVNLSPVTSGGGGSSSPQLSLTLGL